jgi:hypothetical protein
VSPERFFDSASRIDALIEAPDVDAAFEEVRPLLSDDALRAYFFEHLSTWSWLPLLELSGFFLSPPEPTIDDKGGVSLPLWPEVRYLARMASVPEAQAIVCRIVLRMPPTSNSRVHEDLLDIAVALPPRLSVQLFPQALQWAGSRYPFRLAQKLGALIAHFATGGYVSEALELTRSALAVSRAPRADDVPEHLRLPVEAVSHFDVWNYEQILTRDIPAVVQAGGFAALETLCGLLDSAVRATYDQAALDRGEDYSWIWRPAIEDHEQNRQDTISTLLVSAVRDAAERICSLDQSHIQRAVELLEDHRLFVFRRTALHLLRRFLDRCMQLAEDRLTSQSNFDETGLRHEYVLLLAAAFSRLSSAGRSKILHWIANGPNVESFKSQYRDERGHEAPTTDIEQYAEVWRRDRLAPIQSGLDTHWRQRYASLVSRFGDPDHAEFPAYSSATWVGPTSSKTIEDLKAMAAADVVAYLRDWQPPEGLFSPSREGVGRILSAAVQAEPQRFAVIAHSSIGLDPTYVRALLMGLRDALGERKSFAWDSVLDLCEWVVEQPRDIPGRAAKNRDEDPDWGWCRKAIASLLSSGFATDNPGGLPVTLDARAWKVLFPLTNDPEPSIDYERQYGGRNMDPATLSINTVRGEAMHAVIRFALWLYRRASSIEPKTDTTLGLDSRARSVLDKHLDVEFDPALTIRAVYGQWLPWLVLMDKEWTATNVGKILPDNPAMSPFRDAAWDTYLVFNSPYDNVFVVLRSEYEKAVDRIGTTLPDRRSHLADRDDRFAEHLMVFYGRGKLDLADVSGLLRRFYEQASGRLRARSIEFIGRSVRDSTTELPAEVADRFRALWHWRVTAGRGQEGSIDEFSRFGWWFASGKFDEAWSIQQLEESLILAQKTDPVHLVLERLEKAAGRYPTQALRCLRLILDGDREEMGLLGFHQNVRGILAAVMTRGDSVTRDIAIELINALGRKGHRGFRDLLLTSTSSEGS